MVPACMSSDPAQEPPAGASGHGDTGAAKGQPVESKASRWAITIGVVIAFAFGLIVPVFVLVANAEHKANTAVGVRLTADQVKGRELFAQKCASCHTLAAVNSVGRIGPNLDVHIGQEIPSEAARRALVLNTILEGRAIGKGNMPAGLYEGKEAEDVASFVAAVAGH